MVISVWDIFKYIFKWKWLIAAIIIVCIMFSSIYVTTNQSYSAEVVISFTAPDISNGKNPGGDGAFDAYEIIAPSVISEAISELEIKSNVSSIRRAITISPIIPQSILDIQESKMKAGEQYNYYPTEYSVKYTVGSNSSGAYARDVLEAVMKAYGISYADKYLNPYVLPRADFDLSTETHDYIEIAEIMKAKVDETITFLSGKEGAAANYRSPKTGYTFSDILKEYDLLKRFDVSALYSDIFTGHVTQNREVLLKKYERRIDNYAITKQSRLEESNLSHDLMLRYVGSSTKNPSTSEGYKKDSQNVVDSFYDTEIKPDQATYDDLAMSYADKGVEAEKLQIDSDYCQMVVDTFATEVSEEQNKVYTQRVIDSINKLSSKIKKYYDIIDRIARDYNTYLAAQQIVNKTAVSITTNVPVRMNVLIAVVIGLCAGIVVAIAIEVIKKMREIKHGSTMRRRHMLAPAGGVGNDYGGYGWDSDGDNYSNGPPDSKALKYDYDDYDDNYDKSPTDESADAFKHYTLNNDETDGYNTNNANEKIDVDANAPYIPNEDIHNDMVHYSMKNDREATDNIQSEMRALHENNADGKMAQTLSDDELAEIDDIKNYSGRPREEYDPNRHYKWPTTSDKDM